MAAGFKENTFASGVKLKRGLGNGEVQKQEVTMQLLESTPWLGVTWQRAAENDNRRKDGAAAAAAAGIISVHKPGEELLL